MTIPNISLYIDYTIWNIKETNNLKGNRIITSREEQGNATG